MIGEMPAGLIDDEDGMGAGGDGERDFLQVKVHGVGVAAGQDEARADPSGRTDGAEDIGRTGALILGRRGPRSPFRPAPSDLVLLADPGFVLEPNLYVRVWREAVADFRHSGGEVFLKAAIASGSWA